MKIKELLTERIDISWIRPWVDNALPKNNDDNVKWYQDFFANLSKDQTFRHWKKENVKNPLKIKAKLYDEPETNQYILGGEHEVYNDPDEHIIHIEVNTALPLDNDNELSKFASSLSSVLTHELNHAKQQDQRIDKDQKFTDVSLKKNIPPPADSREKRYQYVLDNLEIDAWLGQIAQELKNKLGDKVTGNLGKIFSAARGSDTVVIDEKIIDIGYLKTVYDAINYYNEYLKNPKERVWRKMQKDLYKFL